MCPRINNFQPSAILCSPVDSTTYPLLAAFSCGNSYIDDFFKHKALYSTEHTTHVFWDTAEDTVIALVSLSCSSLSSLYGGISVCDCQPAVEITYFAVDSRYQKLLVSGDKEQGYVSDLIMAMVLSMICDFTAQYCAANTVILYATPQSVHFYERNHFVHADTTRYWRRHSLDIEECIFMYQEL